MSAKGFGGFSLRKLGVAVAVGFLLVSGIALAYPPATVESTPTSVTLAGLDCGTNYRVKVEEQQNGTWTGAQTYTKATAACASGPPVADFSISPDPAQRTKRTTFTSTGSCADTPCTYEWRHGDGSTNEQIGTGESANFTYNGPAGTRTVTLRVTDADGQTGSKSKSFQLVEPSASTPTPTPSPSPTSSPTPTPTPDALPGPSNTGVPAGTTLRPSGRITVSTAGAVIDGLDITASGRDPAISVDAPNVTIRNTRVRANTIALIQNNSTGLVVEASELINRPVAGEPNCHNGIATGQYTARRLEITGCENGAEMFRGGVTFEGNWVHDLDTVGPSYVFGNEEPHTDGIQLNGGGSNVVIRNNNIDPIAQGTTTGGFGTSGIIANSGGDHVRIEDNRISGNRSSYAIYAPRTAKTAWFINRNRLIRGVAGFTACVKVGETVTQFDENRNADTNALLGPDNGVGGGCTN